jgi:hypothetical protein
MFTAYTESQIRDYAESSLQFIGRYSEGQRRAHRQEFAHAVSAMPPLQQILMLESGGTNAVARCAMLDRLRGQSEIENAVGFFMRGRHTLQVNPKRSFASTNGIFWASDSEGDVRPIIYHEHGHRIDAMIADRYFTDHAYYSSASKLWKQAMHRQVNMMVRDAVEEKITGAPFLHYSAKEDSEPLYEDYDRLVDHLEGYSSEDSRLHESYAQMNEHYCMLRAQGDSESVTGRKLKAHLPRLWPVFNGKARGYAVSLARELYQNNHGVPVPANI